MWMIIAMILKLIEVFGKFQITLMLFEVLMLEFPPVSHHFTPMRKKKRRRGRGAWSDVMKRRRRMRRRRCSRD